MLSLDGRLVALESFRNRGINEIIKKIRKYGTPSIISFDRKVGSETVLHIASLFNVSLYLPDYNLREHEKTLLASKYNPRNAHERDACASAVKALKSYGNKLRRIESLDLQKNDKDKAKHMILNGVKLSDTITYLRTMKRINNKEADILTRKQTRQTEKIEDYNRLLNKLTRIKRNLNSIIKENVELHKRIKVLSIENDILHWKLKSYNRELRKDIEKDKQIIFLKNRIKSLKNRIYSQQIELNRFRNKKKTGIRMINNKSNKDNENRGSTKDKKKDLKELLEEIINEYREKRTKKQE